MRLFFALWPPAETARALERWAGEASRDAGGRLTVVENIHLTLAFLGDAHPDKAIAAARGVKGRRHVLPIDAARYVRRNAMIWVGPAVVPAELEALAAELRGALLGSGFVVEERAFAAHVTVVRKARMPQSIPPLPRVEWPVDEFLLVRSRPSSKGSTYESVERFPLA